MEHTQSNQHPSFAVRLIKLPFQGLWFLVKHPIVAIIMALLIAFSSVSFLAHFNPAIAERFNKTVGYFGSSILFYEAGAIIKRKNAALRKAAQALDGSSGILKTAASKIERQAVSISSKNRALLKSSRALDESSHALRIGSAEIQTKDNLLKENRKRLKNFRADGDRIKIIARKRFGKVAIYDAAGEFLGWIPLIGDAASIGMAAAGIYEMCQMFREIEKATDELGVRYQVYTDTFCEKPVEVTKVVIAEKTGVIKEKVVAVTTVFKDYRDSVAIPNKQSMTASVQAMLDEVYALLSKLYDAI